MDNDFIRISNAQLRYYFNIQNPDSLEDEEWCMRVKELQWIRQSEAKEKT